MVHLLRKYQQTLLIAVTVLVIITFIWFWNGSQTTRGGTGGGAKIASIYGQAVTDTEAQRVARKFEIAVALGLNDLVQGLAGHAENQEQALENFVWFSYVFQHEADLLQVFPTDAEVQDELARVPAFQTDGHFDPNKLTDFVQNKLPPLGFNDSVVDDLLREQVRVRKVKALIGSALDVSPAKVRNVFVTENEKMDISVIRLNSSDVAKSIAVTPDEAKKAYDQHKDAFHSDEQRKLTVASFELSDAQKKLEGTERTAALQKLSDDSWTFAQAVADKGADFAAIAKKQGVPLTVAAPSTEAQPDPALARIPAIATAAFRQVNREIPSSDVVEGPNGYYVVHLDDVVPSRQLSFEEAEPRVIAELKKDRAAQLMQTFATQARARILAGLNARKSIADAAIGAGLSAEAIPPFSILEASKLDVPDLQAIVQNAVPLVPGQLGDFAATQAGGLFVYMNSRVPVAPSVATEAEPLLKKQIARQEEMTAFLEWLRIRKDAARLQFVQR